MLFALKSMPGQSCRKWILRNCFHSHYRFLCRSREGLPTVDCGSSNRHSRVPELRTRTYCRYRYLS